MADATKSRVCQEDCNVSKACGDFKNRFYTAAELLQFTRQLFYLCHAPDSSNAVGTESAAADLPERRKQTKFRTRIDTWHLAGTRSYILPSLPLHSAKDHGPKLNIQGCTMFLHTTSPLFDGKRQAKPSLVSSRVGLSLYQIENPCPAIPFHLPQDLFGSL